MKTAPAPHQLTHAEARELTNRIRVTQDALDDDIIAAFQGKAHIALGYATWVEYAAANFPKFKQSPAERLASVSKMSDAGMSTRSIGAALGVGNKTVARDLEGAAVSNDTVAGTPASPTKPSEPTKPVAKKPVSTKRSTNKLTEKLIIEWADLAVKFPSMNDTKMADHLVKLHPGLRVDQKFGHQDVGRLRMFHTAPKPYTDAFFSGALSSAVIETILTAKPKSLSAADRLNMLTKVQAGLVARGAPQIRAAMIEVPKLSPKIRAQWNDTAQAMSYTELLAAVAAEDESYESGKKAHEEFIRVSAAADKTDFGVRAEEWIEKLLDQDLPLIEAELPAIMALGFRARPMAENLRIISKRIWDLAEQIDNRGVRPEPRPAATSFTVIDAEVI